jgi:photosystem II stability/assembly factor-like uncharacterized protein
MYASKTASDEVLVGTREGVVTLARDGAGWRITGRALEDTHVSAIIIDDASGTIFAGGYKGGLHASEDGGKTWERRETGLSQLDVYSLGLKQLENGTRRLYLGTEPAHLFYSDDLGRSWTELPGVRNIPSIDTWTFPAPPHVAHLKHIEFHPTKPETMFASIEQGALLRSDDLGQSWRQVEGMNEDVHRLVINPGNAERMFVTGGYGMYATSDGGTNWDHTTDHDHPIGGYPDQLVVSRSNPDLMIVSAAHDNPGSWRESHFAGSRISRSRDGGRTWEPLTGGLPDRMQSSVEAMVMEDRGDTCAIFAATTSGEVYASEDSGDTWTRIVDGLAPISKAGHYRALVGTPA